MANLGPQYQNLTYGSLLQIPGGVTDQLQVVTDGNGNNTGLLISSTGISIPGLVTTNAQNLNGGSIGSLPYQSGVSTTSFVSAGTPGQVLLSSGTSAPFWANSVPTALLKAGDTMTGTLSMGANNITNLATPVLATDAATKNYVDSVAVGINVKTSCAAATTANITLSGAQTIDGVSVVAGNRVLVKNQTASADNGIYVASASAWTRATDADTWAELIGAMVFISAGTINGLTSWISNTTSGGTIGVTAVTFVQFGASQSYTAGTGITLSGNQFSLTTPVTVSSGGTGVSSLTGVPWGNGGSAMTVATGAQLSGQMAGVGAANQLLQSNGASAPTWTSTPRGTSFQFNGSVANSVTINAGTSPASQTYSLPAAYPSVSGQVLSSTTGGAMSWASIATTSGQSILAGNNSGGFQNVTLSGLSYNTSTSTLSVTGGGSSGLVYNVKDYGAVGNASTDDTASIQNAINAASGGGTVYFPPGNYRITSVLNITNWGVNLVGSGQFASQLYQTNSGSGMLYFNNVAGCSLSNLSFLYSATPTGGSVIQISNTAGEITLQNFFIRNCYIGINITNHSVAVYMDNFTIQGTILNSVICNNVNDIFFSNFTISCPSTSAYATDGHIRLINQAEAITMVNGDVIGGVLAMRTSSSTYPSVGTFPQRNAIANMYFDSNAGGVEIYQAEEFDFVNCWFATASAAAGVTLAVARSNRFTNCKFYNNGYAGARVAATATFTTFTACDFQSNSKASSGGYAGCQIDSGTSDVQVLGCVGNNNLFSGLQAASLFIGSGADNFIVSNNNFRSASGGGIINNAGTGATKIVAQNLG